MKFAAGYQCITDGQMFSETVADYRDKIGEIYFAFPGTASGRPGGGNIPERIEQLEYELGCLRQMGIALDILFNGNCYGSWAVSERFQREIVSTLERLESLDLLPEIDRIMDSWQQMLTQDLSEDEQLLLERMLLL